MEEEETQLVCCDTATGRRIGVFRWVPRCGPREGIETRLKHILLATIPLLRALQHGIGVMDIDK